MKNKRENLVIPGFYDERKRDKFCIFCEKPDYCCYNCQKLLYFNIVGYAPAKIKNLCGSQPRERM